MVPTRVETCSRTARNENISEPALSYELSTIATHDTIDG